MYCPSDNPNWIKHPYIGAAPTLPNGKPAPPISPLPNGKNGQPNEWVPKDSGGGARVKWGPKYPVPSKNGGQPSSSWDDGNGTGTPHWDIDNGNGTRTRVDAQGNPVSDEEAHPRPAEPTPEKDADASSNAFSRVGEWIGNHKGEIAVGAVVVGAILLAPETGGASLAVAAAF
jgi:hypothetical protein